MRGSVSRSMRRISARTGVNAAGSVGSALRGATTLLAFGLGTLPNLMLAGLLLARFRSVIQGRALRLGAGLLVLASFNTRAAPSSGASEGIT